MRYCLGFAFGDHDNHVVLIRKTKPDWQKGRLNGVGGKVEEGESARTAMVREFMEETGIVTHSEGWTEVTRMNFDGAEVHCFATRLRPGTEPFPMTEETPMWFHVMDLTHPKVIENLRWLVPMALYKLDHPEENSVPHTLDHE